MSRPTLAKDKPRSGGSHTTTSVDVQVVTDPDRWDELVQCSPEQTPFHLSECLRVLQDWSNATLHPLVGFDGQEPIGLLPIYEIKKGPLSVAVSPPPHLKVSYQGPLLLSSGGIEAGRAEMRHRRFVETCLDFLEEELSPNYVNIRTGPRFDNVCPFLWNDFDVSTGFTYVVDTSRGKEEILASFSSDARRNVCGGIPDDCRIRVGGADEIRRIVEQMNERHDEQGERYPVTAEYVVDLWRSLPEGAIRPYAYAVDGSFAGGMITLELGETIYRWKGGAKPGCDIPINDHLDWHIIREAIDRGFTRYDMVGANHPRISPFKAKFAPELKQYYELSRCSSLVGFAVDLYSRCR